MIGDAASPPGGEADVIDLGPVEAVMRPGTISCTPETPLAVVAATMAENQVHSVIVTDTNVDELYSEAVAERLVEAGSEVDILAAEAGEHSKSAEVAAELWEQMLEQGTDRKSVGIAVGGGAVGGRGIADPQMGRPAPAASRASPRPGTSAHRCCATRPRSRSSSPRKPSCTSIRCWPAACWSGV